MPVINERHKELKRRRHRKKVYAKFKATLAKNPTNDERRKIADKLRKLTPAAEELIERWGL
ncbi:MULTISPECIES: DUF6800 family protein [Bremerella]|uniref:DUF6800 family protein n=1 Tax=Bremerella TaxID=2714594 RepID=UPI0031EDD2F2